MPRDVRERSIGQQVADPIDLLQELLPYDEALLKKCPVSVTLSSLCSDETLRPRLAIPLVHVLVKTGAGICSKEK